MGCRYCEADGGHCWGDKDTCRHRLAEQRDEARKIAHDLSLGGDAIIMAFKAFADEAAASDGDKFFDALMMLAVRLRDKDVQSIRAARQDGINGVLGELSAARKAFDEADGEPWEILVEAIDNVTDRLQGKS